VDQKIVGTTMPVLEMTLQDGERIVAEAGQLSWMTGTIELHTTASAGGGGGIFGALKRVAGGGTLFMTEYSARGGAGMVAFATKVPGHILPVRVQPGQGYLIHRHGFLCATPGVELSAAFQRSLGAGIFGGNGFVLQRLGGTADAWVELDGEVVTYDLGPGETLRVHPGHVGMFEERIAFDVTTIKGVRNMLFGGDGLFLAQLTGPGKVWLQSLPLPNLAHALSHYLGGGGETARTSVAAGLAGAALGGLLGGGERNES
jgi:uncharacterized protein (TIGR00266 family)